MTVGELVTWTCKHCTLTTRQPAHVLEAFHRCPKKKAMVKMVKKEG